MCYSMVVGNLWTIVFFLHGLSGYIRKNKNLHFPDPPQKVTLEDQLHLFKAQAAATSLKQVQAQLKSETVIMDGYHDYWY